MLSDFPCHLSASWGERTYRRRWGKPQSGCPCWGGRMIIVETFDGARPARSTDQDRHLMTVVALPAAQRRSSSSSNHTPEHEPDVLATSANSLQPSRPHPPLASSSPKKRVVFAPHDNIGRLPPPAPHGRSLRDPKIPVAPVQPNPRLFLPAVSSLRGFRTPAPRPVPASPAKGRRPKPFSKADLADRGFGLAQVGGKRA